MKPASPICARPRQTKPSAEFLLEPFREDDAAATRAALDRQFIRHRADDRQPHAQSAAVGVADLPRASGDDLESRPVVLDFETDLDNIADAYAAMDERRAIKSLIRVGSL